MAAPLRNKCVLVVDDEPANLQKLKRTLIGDYVVLEARSGEQALEILTSHPDIEVIITDQRMPNMTGVEFLGKTIELNPDIIRIILTGFTDVQDLMQAINTGRVYRYITKPWEPEAIRQAIRDGLERTTLIKENERLARELKAANEKLQAENLILKTEVNRKYASAEIVYASTAMQSILDLLRKISLSDIAVLIQGETGTGKERLARFIHEQSRRKQNLFVPVNCGAIPRELVESEFFGHVKGSYTGASYDKKGLFEIAHEGTIFLDEIGEAPPELQVKLLRVLQEGEILPVGAGTPRKVSVRVVASTNRDLRAEVARMSFRQDLFFRLNAFSILIPPLRERAEDIVPLTREFVDRASRRQNKPVNGYTQQVLDALLAYDWPGNVRELENEIERMVILAEPEAKLDYDLLSDHVKRKTMPLGTESAPLRIATGDLERLLIKEALSRNDWNRTRAAQVLGISRQSLIAKIKRYDL
ncbi:MAG: sigma-54-dependent Fis family transcriptional regulator [Acidobacteria bacterium]|nr:sigma-54-dependent Fis family transcriptional regulator [Acidobacteriota bacterium]MBI3657753.1 sigma-54-dependent Fis family transcriptional regulator [Acidobacteriota bacterium]